MNRAERIEKALANTGTSSAVLTPVKRCGGCKGAAKPCAGCKDGKLCDESRSKRALTYPVPVPTVRHLLYHVYPRAGSRWRERVARLRERIGVFNGTKTVAIAIDGTCDPPELVRDALDGCGCAFVHVRNNPNRREVESFLPLFESVAQFTGPEHCTLYAHAKGSSRPPGAPVHRWAEVLEQLMLDRSATTKLIAHPIAGCFKKVGHGWGRHESASDWHYSGSWFWFRNAELFARENWRTIDQFWGGIEPYPSLHFRAQDAGCVFHQGRVPGLNLYDHNYWRTRVEPELDSITRSRAAQPGRSRLLNFGCGPHYFPGWHNVDVHENDAIKPDEVIRHGRYLPWVDGAFDRIYLGHVLEHVRWDDVPTLLQELRRVLSRDGEIRVVGPDCKKALETGGDGRDLWDLLEDDAHRQLDSLDDDWDGARHYWNCYGARVARALTAAGFSAVEEIPLSVEQFGLSWPVADYVNPAQCAVKARR